VRRLMNPRVIGITLGVLALMAVSAYVLKVPLPAIVLPAEPIACIGGHLEPAEHGLHCASGFPFTNSMAATLVADLTIFLVFFFALRNKKLIPSGLQNAVEAVIEWFYTLVEDIAGKENARTFFPIVMTIFTFALFANWWELVPGMDAFGWIVEKHHGDGWARKELFAGVYTLVKEKGHYTLVPWLRTATTDLNVTIAMALIAVAYVQIAGVRFQGWKYFKKFIRPGYMSGGLMATVLDVFVGFLELISELARIVSFSFRLFGNIFAGTVLLFVMPYLIPLFVPLPFYGLEVFVGMIQAFVFAVLTLVFIVMAIISHGEHEGH